ncbi:JAB domain-containing protein [Xylocopilactobacillus apicola]|nr:JAB domain-containing protein [Xylocopilactobacillus apicola]
MDSLKLEKHIEKYGFAAIDDEDLLKIILGTPSLIDDELGICLSLRDLAFLDFEQLSRKTSLNDQEILKLLASVELGNRVFEDCQLRFGQLTTSKDAGEISLSFFQNIYQECLVGFFLDVNKKLIKSEIIFKGTLDASIACPRDVLVCALKYHAHSFILAHNHPSGECIASKADLRFTKKMAQAAQIMGVEFTDHLVVGSKRYLSLREENLFN